MPRHDGQKLLRRAVEEIMVNTRANRVLVGTLLTLSMLVGFQAYDAQAQGGRIVIANDDWPLSDRGFAPPNDPGVFAQNVAAWFTGGKPGRFLAYSDHLGLTGKMLADAMAAAGHTWIVDTSVTFNLPTLMGYDGVFLGVTPADNQVLIDYVNAGGKVYVYSGGDTESGKWNAFLQQFGLHFEIANNGLIGDVPVSSSHPLFSGVDHLYHDTGTSILDLDLADPKNQVVATFQGQGLFAVYDGVVGPRVGGSVTGVGPTKVICRNMTTKQKVIIRDRARLWDCEAAGLIVHPGDTIQQTVRGAAD